MNYQDILGCYHETTVAQLINQCPKPLIYWASMCLILTRIARQPLRPSHLLPTSTLRL